MEESDILEGSQNIIRPLHIVRVQHRPNPRIYAPVTLVIGSRGFCKVGLDLEQIGLSS